MLKLNNELPAYIYPVTKTLSVKSPRQFDEKELAYIRKDVRTFKWKEGDRVMYNHFTETFLIKREESHG